MTYSRPVAVIALLSLIALPGFSTTVYKKVKEDGTIIFSDQPFDDAQKIEVDPVPVMNIAPVKLPETSSEPQQETPSDYKTLAITQPAMDESFVNNGGNVTVNLQIEPPLFPAHKVQLLMNGAVKVSPGTSTSFNFSNLNRGSYTIQAQILDQNGKLIKSSQSITFHVRRSFRK